MIEQVGKLFWTAAKWAPAPTFGVAIASSLVIFLPGDVAQRLGIAEFRTEHRDVLGWSFLLAWSYLLAAIIWYGKGYVGLRIRLHRRRRAREQSLCEVTPEEKGYLIEYMGGRNTMYCDISDGVAGGLLAKEIIYRSSNMVNMAYGIPYNIPPWAKRYLAERPELLEGMVPRKRRSMW